MSSQESQSTLSLVLEQLAAQVEELQTLDRLLDGELEQSQVAEIAYECGCDAEASPDEIVNQWLSNQLEVSYFGRKEGDLAAAWHVTGIDILAAYGGPTIRIVRMNTVSACSPMAIVVKVSWWMESTEGRVAAPRLAEFLDQLIELADEYSQSPREHRYGGFR